MWERRFDLSLTLLLLVSLAATALIGLLADYLGIPRSLYHRIAAYSLTVLALIHTWRRRRQLWSRLKGATGIRPKSMPLEPAIPGTKLPHMATSRRVFLASGLAAAVGFVTGRWLRLTTIPSDLEAADFGLVYHSWSKPSWQGLVQKPFQWGESPPLYKEYPSAERTSLPRDFSHRGLFVEEAIEQRRSQRDYSGKPLTLEQLSLLLHSAYGITEPSYPLRASPSAGALFPLEIYPVVGAVDGLAAGVYHYRPFDHSLDLMRNGDLRSSLLAGTGGQDLVSQAAATLVIAAIFQRTRWKYQERAYRYVLLEAGHVGQNLYLAATSLGLACCAIGAFLDDEINELIGVDGKEESVVYLVSIGRRD